MSWTIATCLKLGRVSNLPTVWTNTIAGVVLAGTPPDDWRILLLLFAMTLAYTGGMFLNDAFDREIDAKERPERPIPSGDVSAYSVFFAGFAMLACSVLLVAYCSVVIDESGGWRPVVAVIALAGAIVLYNAWHKANPLSPFVMGLCRMLVYITAGWTFTAQSSNGLYLGALALLCYLIGLTYTAKQENLGTVKNLWPLSFLVVPAIYTGILARSNLVSWLTLVLFVAWIFYALRFVFRRQPGDIPKAVVFMIAGISLIDAMFIAATGSLAWVVLTLFAFCLTLFLQRYIAGT